MKNLLNYFLIFVCGIFIISCASTAVVKNAWQTNAVVVDGKPDEWQLPLKYFDSETKLNYFITNDKENLYVCIRASDVKTQEKIMRAGMQVYIDTMGKGEKQVGIEYPLPASDRTIEEDYGAATKPGEKPDYDRLHAKFLKNNNEMYLSGFKSTINGRTFLKNSEIVKVNLNWDATNSMTFEAKIPFSSFYKKEITARDSLKNFGLTMIVNAVAKPKTLTGGPSQPPSGMNGSVGAMGGIPGTAGTPTDPIHKKNVLKIKIKLAAQ